MVLLSSKLDKAHANQSHRRETTPKEWKFLQVFVWAPAGNSLSSSTPKGQRATALNLLCFIYVPPISACNPPKHF
jgi:hypothetical protein